MKNTTIALAIFAVCSIAQADPLIDQSGTCPTGVTGAASGSCTNQNQQLGNTTSSIAGDVQAPVTSAQQGVSSTSNASGNAINPSFDNKAQVTQNSTNTTTGTINPTINPNTSSSATGNTSANQSSATTGPSTASSGPVTGTNTNTSRFDGSVSSANQSAGGKATAAGGTGLASGGLASSQQGTTVGTSVDASNRSTANYKVIAPQWAPIFPGPAAPPVAAGNLLQDIGACGPRGIIISHKVTGIQRTAFGGREHIDQGYDQELVDDPVPYIYINGVPHGHIVTTWTVTIAVSNAASLSLGGFKDGAGVQGGGSSSAALVRLVQRFTTRTCVLAVKEPQAVLQQTLVPAPRQDRN